MREKGGRKGSETSVLGVRNDDDDDDGFKLKIVMLLHQKERCTVTH